ncbi:MAG: 2-oxoacid:ferredoxin oxidoreductase subunit beta [Candidatus Pacebacteria bacterium]|nr:2-oxoacid:ferredoxin oxidoreductase subunit beta [Candidatus Paceibacterota bacterium]
MAIEDYNSKQKPTWCPGCGNYAIWMSIKAALDELGIPPHKVLIVYGIGCSGNMFNNINVYGWHALHGRALPVAIGAKLANKDLTVIAVAGDGDGLGEGMGHFIHALRGNVDITYLIHENKVFGLTAGQSAPTSMKGFVSKSTPEGVIEDPTNAVSLALTAGGEFVARGYAGKPEQLKNLIKQGIQHKGFSFVDILQPCIAFNKVNTYQYYNDRVYDLQAENHQAEDFDKAFIKAEEWGAKIPTGLFYQAEGGTREDNLIKESDEKDNLTFEHKVEKRNLERIIKNYSTN